MSQFITTIYNSYGVEYCGNFFETGDGKNDLDAHFGLIEGIEKRFLIQFDRISGMIMTT